MSKFDDNKDKNKQPSLFGIPFAEQESENKNSWQLDFMSNNNAINRNLTPAEFQSLNSLELAMQKPTFEKADYEALRSVLNLLPIAEISRLRPTISVASLDNLIKKADIYEKTQTIERSTLTNQKEEIKNKYLDNENDLFKDQESKNSYSNQKLLSKEETNKLMANFLSERNDLAQNMEEKNKQVSLENNKQNNLSN
jgi:hypothetical protein